jgi:hypothetical protein
MPYRWRVGPYPNKTENERREKKEYLVAEERFRKDVKTAETL